MTSIILPQNAGKRVPKFLLIDDERDYITTLSERLEMRDIPSDVAFDGEQALSLFREKHHDVIVLDLRMPGMSGHEVLRRVKKELPYAQVIIVSGHGNEKDEALARELGAFEYLNKPVDLAKLADIMQRAAIRAREEEQRQSAASPAFVH